MPDTNTDCDSVWSYQGYHLDKANFATAMIHLYRAEVQRANVWRNRLDNTTNWGVVTSAAALTFAFSTPDNPHFLLLLVLLLMFTFINMEARRYRYYALWSYRVHLMETEFFATMLTPPFQPSADWGDRMAETLRAPEFVLAWWEAVGIRFRRNYVWLTSLLLISWGIKLHLHPYPSLTVGMAIERAEVSFISGQVVVGAFLLMYALLVVLAALTLLPREKRPWRVIRRARVKTQVQARRCLATIITVHGEMLAQRLMQELGRSVTALEGTGMYTGQKRDVLLCAITEAQIVHLETCVQGIDKEAFVVISPTTGIRGGGFDPLLAPS